MNFVKSNRYVIFLLGLVLTMYGCDENSIHPCERGEGATVSEIRSVSNFTGIKLDVPADLYLSRGSTFSVEISAQDNILDEISTEVVGDKLVIDNEKCFRNHKTITIEITMPEVTLLEIDGSGDIFGQDRFESDHLNLYVDGSGSIEFEADADEIDIDIDGSGNITFDTEAINIETDIDGSGDLFLSGNASTHDINIDGSGDVFAFDTPVNDCYIKITGSGDCEVTVDNKLDVTIRGSGDVHYKGSPPDISVDITGSGRLINEN